MCVRSCGSCGAHTVALPHSVLDSCLVYTLHTHLKFEMQPIRSCNQNSFEIRNAIHAQLNEAELKRTGKPKLKKPNKARRSVFQVANHTAQVAIYTVHGSSECAPTTKGNLCMMRDAGWRGRAASHQPTNQPTNLQTNQPTYLQTNHYLQPTTAASSCRMEKEGSHIPIPRLKKGDMRLVCVCLLGCECLNEYVCIPLVYRYVRVCAR